MRFKKFACHIFLIICCLSALTACGKGPLGDAPEPSAGMPSASASLPKAPGDSVELTPSEYSQHNLYTPDQVSLETEYQVYANDISQLYITMTNHMDQELFYGAGYFLEYYDQGQWYNTNTHPSQLIMIGYGLATGDSRSECIYLYPDQYHWTEGRYRIVKPLIEPDRSMAVAAEFTLGPSPITPDTPFGFAPLEDLPEDYTADMAQKDGVIVVDVRGGTIHNADKLIRFLDNIKREVPSMIRIMNFTVEGDPVIADITYWDFGLQTNLTAGYQPDTSMYYFKYQCDTSRDRFGSGENFVISRSFLLGYTDTSGRYFMCLSDYPSQAHMTEKEDPFLIPVSLSDEDIELLKELEEERVQFNSCITRSSTRITACMRASIRLKTSRFIWDTVANASAPACLPMLNLRRSSPTSYGWIRICWVFTARRTTTGNTSVCSALPIHPGRISILSIKSRQMHSPSSTGTTSSVSTKTGSGDWAAPSFTLWTALTKSPQCATTPPKKS
ncbi:MAG: immunoglobulin-like domain-containing protein [Christensenellales bacterium]|jgi:hypothetical protein